MFVLDSDISVLWRSPQRPPCLAVGVLVRVCVCWLSISDTPGKNICFSHTHTHTHTHTRTHAHTHLCTQTHSSSSSSSSSIFSVSQILKSCRLSWLRNSGWLTPVDLFMRRGSILALGLSLGLASYSLSLLTTFVVVINITFWHPDRYAFREDSSKLKFSTSP